MTTELQDAAVELQQSEAKRAEESLDLQVNYWKTRYKLLEQRVVWAKEELEKEEPHDALSTLESAIAEGAKNDNI